MTSPLTWLVGQVSEADKETDTDMGTRTAVATAGSGRMLAMGDDA